MCLSIPLLDMMHTEYCQTSTLDALNWNGSSRKVESDSDLGEPTTFAEGTNMNVESVFESYTTQAAPVLTAESPLDHQFTIYEPERILPSFAPPKRFYRTFWRSIVHKAVRRESQRHKNKEIN